MEETTNEQPAESSPEVIPVALESTESAAPEEKAAVEESPAAEDPPAAEETAAAAEPAVVEETASEQPTEDGPERFRRNRSQLSLLKSQTRISSEEVLPGRNYGFC